MNCKCEKNANLLARFSQGHEVSCINLKLSDEHRILNIPLISVLLFYLTQRREEKCWRGQGFLFCICTRKRLKYWATAGSRNTQKSIRHCRLGVCCSFSCSSRHLPHPALDHPGAAHRALAVPGSLAHLPTRETPLSHGMAWHGMAQCIEEHIHSRHGCWAKKDTTFLTTSN